MGRIGRAEDAFWGNRKSRSAAGGIQRPLSGFANEFRFEREFYTGERV